jgi:recombination protein RecR
MNQQYPSTLLEKAVGEFSKLPGIGRKTAMRLVLHLLRQDTSVVEAFGSSIITLKHEVKYCKVCHNILIQRLVRSAQIRSEMRLWFVS